MNFTSVEWIALVVVILSVVKMLVLLVKPQAWMNFAKGVYGKPAVTSFVALILAAIVLYYLTQSGITIVQILAVTAFVALIIMIGLAPEVPYFIKKYQAMIKQGRLWKEYWLYALVWIALLAWGASELFM